MVSTRAQQDVSLIISLLSAKIINQRNGIIVAVVLADLPN
jgi:hypothetical protein